MSNHDHRSVLPSFVDQVGTGVAPEIPAETQVAQSGGRVGKFDPA
jgi:hypothetical protein